MTDLPTLLGALGAGGLITGITSYLATRQKQAGDQGLAERVQLAQQTTALITNLAARIEAVETRAESRIVAVEAKAENSEKKHMECMEKHTEEAVKNAELVGRIAVLEKVVTLAPMIKDINDQIKAMPGDGK